jgi:two-component system response regulator AtoC
VARAIHARSSRASGPFVKVHCAALPDTLLESELFGYERGAFTGATSSKPGRVELAEGGTLFLDEIGDINPVMQVKLLRLLQDREYERLGGTRTIRADVRFVSATHRALENMVKAGDFREDLFYRLNVVPIWLPPLRARPDDIGPLARHFCAAFARQHQRPGLALTGGAIEALEAERWPGNVRQLQNLIERLVVMTAGNAIDAPNVRRELSPEITFVTKTGGSAVRPPSAVESASGAVMPLDDVIRSAERRAIERALQHAKGNRALAARLLGTSRANLYNKLDEYGLGKPNAT